MQQKSELPEGWVRTTLDFITHEIVRGPFGSALKKSFFVPSGYKVYEQKNVIYQDFSLGNYYVDEAKFQELKRFEIKPKDVLISCSGTVGKIVIVPNEIESGIINQALLKLSINENVLFLPYFTRLFEFKVQGIVADNTRGSAMLNLSSVKDLKTVPFEIPPLSEQHRIVSAIEALFARLDATNEMLDRVPEILKKFRQSVLAAACDGRLTEGWREENTNKDDISIFFESIKKKRMEYWKKENLEKLISNSKMPQNDTWKQKYKEPEYLQNFNSLYLPDEWMSVTVDQIASKVTDGDHNPPKRVENGIPHLTAKNIKNWKITFDNCTYISPDDFEVVKTRYNPQKDDIIITCVGTIGETAIVPDNLVFSADRNLAVIRLTEKGMDPKFLQYILNAPLWNDIIKKGSSSTAQPHFYLKDIRALTIPLPPLPEQQEIVRRVNALFAFTDSIEAKVAAAKEKTEKLRQSILAKAFYGQLVETEAEIARREGRDYETAEVLLERIKEERGKGGKKR